MVSSMVTPKRAPTSHGERAPIKLPGFLPKLKRQNAVQPTGGSSGRCMDLKPRELDFGLFGVSGQNRTPTKRLKGGN